MSIKFECSCLFRSTQCTVPTSSPPQHLWFSSSPAPPGARRVHLLLKCWALAGALRPTPPCGHFPRSKPGHALYTIPPAAQMDPLGETHTQTHGIGITNVWPSASLFLHLQHLSFQEKKNRRGQCQAKPIKARIYTSSNLSEAASTLCFSSYTDTEAKVSTYRAELFPPHALRCCSWGSCRKAASQKMAPNTMAPQDLGGSCYTTSAVCRLSHWFWNLSVGSLFRKIRPH